MRSPELLVDLNRDIKIIIETVEKEFLSLPPEALQWKEDANRWSILECFEHLNRYSRYYHPVISERLKNSSSPKSAEIKSTWLGRMFINMMHPKNVKKQKTMKRMDPSFSRLTNVVLDEFLTHQMQLLEFLQVAQTVDLNNVRVPVEFMKLLTMNGGDALQFLVVHEQRHLNQAKGVRVKVVNLREPVLKV